MEIIKPKELKQGDTIGILAVSGRIKDYECIHNAALYFQKCGYNTIISNTCKANHRYMAGLSDDDCVNELHKFFKDDNIDAIVCARGGYGTLRLLNKINWNIIKENPKIFAGYSDITTLLTMIYKKTGLVTFHSAMANGDFGKKVENYTANSFFNTLKGLNKEFYADNAVIYKRGKTAGILWGGNLSCLSALCGTDFVPENDIILFIEDVNEPVYKIDRMLNQLFNVKELKKRVKGIAIGEFKEVDNSEMLDEVIGEIADILNIPIIRGFKITHGEIKDTMPIGVISELDTDKKLIEIKENYLL